MRKERTVYFPCEKVGQRMHVLSCSWRSQTTRMDVGQHCPGCVDWMSVALDGGYEPGQCPKCGRVILVGDNYAPAPCLDCRRETEHA